MKILEVIKEADIGTKVVVAVLAVSLIFSGILIAGNNKKKSNKTVVAEKLEEVNIIDNSSGILINENTLTLENGVNYLLSVEKVPQTSDESKLKYTSSNKDVAEVTDLGLIKTKAIGSAVITVMSEDDEKIKDEIKIVVVGSTVKAEKISLSESKLSLTVGQTFELKASIIPENTTNKSVEWISSNSEVATIDNFGKIIAKKAGKTTITAKTINGIKSTGEVEVISEIEPEIVELTGSSVTIGKGKTYSLSATIKPNNVKNKSLTWKSDNTNIVEVDDKGMVIGINSGTATVTVKTSNSKSDSIKITVSEVTSTQESPTTEKIIYPTGVSLDSVLVNLYPDEEQQLTAEVNPDTATNQEVTWNSSNNNIAIVDDGLITAVNPGEAVVTAKTSNGKTTNVRVVVNEDPNSPTGVSLSATLVNIYIGEQQLIISKVDPDTATDQEVTWNSSNNNIAIVDDDGLITAVNPGEAVVTAKTSNGKTTNVRVVVNNEEENDDEEEEEGDNEDPVDVESINLNVKNVLLSVNKRQQVTVNFEPNKATDKSITWTSSDSTIATVTNTGLITAKKSGTATITAKTSNNKTATATVTVPGEQKTTIPTTIPTKAEITNSPIEPGTGATVVKSARSSTLITSIEKKSDYYVTRMWVKDPTTQFRKAITSGWGKYFETVNTMADREILLKSLQNKIMVAINASAWHTPDVDEVSGYDYTSYGTFVLVDGQMKRNNNTNSSYRSHNYYAIDGSGNLKVFTDNKTNRSTLYQTIISAGVKNTFSFGLPAIVNNGQVSVSSGGAEAKRQTLCQIDKNNFIIMTVTGDKTVYEAAIILRNLGCKIAVNLDGGSSIRLTFKSAGEDKVTTIAGGSRKVADILYVTE